MFFNKRETDTMNIKKIFKQILPEQIVNSIKYLYSFVPIEKRMGKDYSQLKSFIKDAQFWDRDRIQEWQLKKLKKIVRYAYDNVPGYHLLYRDAGVSPEAIFTLQDIALLPCITKEIIRENLDDFTSRKIPRSKLIFATTGGSSGIPLGFYHTPTNVWMENAFMHSGWERVGWRLGDSSAVLRGTFRGSKDRLWKREPISNEIHLSSYFLSGKYYNDYFSILDKYKPLHLQAYPSAAILLSDLIIKNNDIGKIVFNCIFLGSENIYDWQKKRIATAFPTAKVFGWYGHTEQNILAPMCEYSTQYHLWPFYGMTEILNESRKPATQGELGELVGTSFWSYGTPFIRYKTGDLAEKGASSCPLCNRQFDMIQRIEGRNQEFVIASDGTFITLTALIFAQHFHAFNDINTMQLHQKAVGEVTVNIIPTNRFSEEDAQEIKSKMESAASGRLQVYITIAEEIQRTPRGKQPFLLQELNIDWENRR